MARGDRIVIGLNSGTSADGVDAAAVAIRGRGEAMTVRCLGHVARPYPKELRKRILAIMAPAATRTEELAALDVEIGREFAETAENLMNQLNLGKVDFIGSHGQTICHLPPGRAGAKKKSINATLQIGDPATIAARLKTPVVSHFRQADMAAGGQGAPLVPWTDWILLRHPQRTRIIQNIGGIANLTYLKAGGGPEDVIAFDTGPGNMVIDALVSHFSNGRESYDIEGRRAARGDVNDTVFSDFARHPFRKRRPPKSCGRDEFGLAYTQGLLERHAGLRLPVEDWLATATKFTVECMAEAYYKFLPRVRGKVFDEVIVCGGGARNHELIGLLNHCLWFDDPEFDLRTTVHYGIPIEAKEAVSFGVLAAARIDGVPANLPKVTGAKRRVVLGDVSMG